MGTLQEQVETVLVALRRIIRATDIHSRKLIQSYGLTVPQLIILKVVEQNKSTTIGEIAKAVNLSQATVTNIISRLEMRGYLYRTQHDKDKRCVVVKLTEKGALTVSQSPSLLHERFIESFQMLKDWEQLQIISSLQRVAEMMDATDVKALPVLTSGYDLPDDVKEIENMKESTQL